MKLCGAQSQQQVPDLPKQVLERSEEFREVGVVSLDVEGALGEYEEATDDRESGDGEHEAATKIISFCCGHYCESLSSREVMKYYLSTR